MQNNFSAQIHIFGAHLEETFARTDTQKFVKMI